ncbi:PIN domain-containing protein [Vreelandella neptunia]|uniref:PIN domain-containing protein n=1 Tax=Vreelandella neptunia TaxID=115551 RepID=A0ABZ0YQH5_9GAMM|nr:PIN domain-containing protein [Halomonas neptunia]MDN3559254.1 PIN domain-containing protein [Halomonas neptunia]WQH14213.1 PIN domain-containing protein [Halomonas neptunia]
MTEKIENEYSAILVDTSIFVGNGLRLEKGLLGKLTQFKKSPIDYLFPDVIKNEVKVHLEGKIKVSRAALEKALNDAGDHLFFEGSELNDAKQVLIDSTEIEGLAESRVNKFIESTGALVLESGDYVSVSELLTEYFSNKPPFAETGKKKNEFPDAIVLMAIEAWADENDIYVLAVAKDGDWKSYCDSSERIDYQEDLSEALSNFNRTNAPYALLANLEKALNENTAGAFLSSIEAGLESAFDGFTPDQEADSHLYWEPEGCHGWFKAFELFGTEFKIIDKDEDWVVLEALANITVEAEGEFSLSVYDSIDRDHVYMGGITATVVEEFVSEILITISGDLDGPIDDLEVEEVEVVSPIGTIDFGTIEPDYSEYD